MPPFNSPLPVQQFRALNESKSKDIPYECPEDSPITSLNIKCGPILKLFNCNDGGDGKYLASMLVVLKDYKLTTVPTLSYQVGPKVGTDSAKGSFPGTLFYSEGQYHFFRYLIELDLTAEEQVCHYTLNSETVDWWKFYLPAKTQAMNVISFSCNGFSLGANADDYKSSLWYDVLQKHGANESERPYHVMLGGGDQIYCDSVKIMAKKLQQWTEMPNSDAKLKFQVDDEFVQQLCEYYLNHYFAWFGKGFWTGNISRYIDPLFPISMCTIPAVNIYDDHDIIDGYGSYPESTMGSLVFTSLGKLAFKYYMIFQHHQLPEDTLPPNFEAAWVKTKTKNFIDQPNHSVVGKLGADIGLVGIDCRTERSLDRINSDKTYKSIFSALDKQISNNKDTKHLLVMLGVPILYPRLVWLEMVLNSPLLKPLKKLAEMGVINKGLVNEFDGSVEVLDDLNDHWCSKHHKAERNKLCKDLIDFGAKNGVRVTILSGDVHLCCIGRLKSRIHKHPSFHPIHGKEAEKKNANILESPEYDPRLIFNVTSSAIINAPPPDPMAQLLDKRSKGHHFNKYCDEDIVPLFNLNTDGTPRENYQFLNKRNWCDLIYAPNSKYLEKLPASDENITKMFPSSTKKEVKKPADSHFIKYPLLPDSLVTTLHVEDDPCDFDCKTMDYELLIPPLRGEYDLNEVVIKHVNDS